MKSRTQHLQKDFVLLTFSMFVIVCLWVGFNIYHAYATSTIDETLQLNILPINGDFDNKTLQKLQTRQQVLPDFVSPLATVSADTDVRESNPTLLPSVTISTIPTIGPEEQAAISTPAITDNSTNQTEGGISQ